MSLIYDPRRPEVLADPYPVFHQLQAEDPVHRSEILGGWVLTRYDDVKAALSDSRLSSDRITPFVNHHAKDGRGDLHELGHLVGLWAVFTDPPTHTRLRGLMNRAFTSRAVERLRPRIEEIVATLLEAVRPHGRMDVIRDFAYPLPIAVIAEMIGVPREDCQAFKTWSDDLASFIGSALTTPDKYERAARAIIAMADYFRRMIPARRANPREDIMSALVAARDRDEALGADELVASCILLLFAGHETTTNLIGNGLLALLRHPAQARALRDDPGLTGPAVEEILRYDGPTGAMVRVAAEDVRLEGRTIRRGERVFTMINAANRDPRQFEEPDRLDLARANNHHIAFGYGIHFCLGAPLARLEGQIAIPALLRALAEPALDGGEPAWLDSLVFRGVKSLPVTFRVGSRPIAR
ncbi:MAG: cytochrome P450 [Candidatus Rokubacteria bacterium]|nr:cytochrome P450 [Candidatus Rokubacteria bacterium]